jgi:hypothetical protein
LFLQESNFQIRYNPSHERGWADCYLVTVDGSVTGRDAMESRDFEFFEIRSFRKHASRLFRDLLTAAGACFMECQLATSVYGEVRYEAQVSLLYSSCFIRIASKTLAG